MTILKHQTTADGYECRLVKPSPGFKHWQVKFNGRWMTLQEVRKTLPVRTCSSAIQHRVSEGKNLIPVTFRALLSCRLELWDQSLTPSKWAAGWARKHGVRNTPEMRSAFVRHLAAEVERTPDRQADALKRTLKDFTYLHHSFSANGHADVSNR